jgi:hypothetical protein
MKRDKLQGVQLPLLERFPKLAYRVRTKNGTLVLCDEHLENLRRHEAAPLTGETFAAELCDVCLPEEKL